MYVCIQLLSFQKTKKILFGKWLLYSLKQYEREQFLYIYLLL